MVETERMKSKRVRLQVEWTDVVIRRVEITVGGLKPATVPAVACGGNYHRATRSAARGPRRMIQIFA